MSYPKEYHPIFLRTTPILQVTLVVVGMLIAGQARAMDAIERFEGDEEAIVEVISKFDTALQNLDIEEMGGLFYDGRVVWFGTSHLDTRAFIRDGTGQELPAVEDVDVYEFFDVLREQGTGVREEFGTPKILTDGQLATVSFDYHFEENDEIRNWGFETWQMVKTGDGWKIVHVMFSYNLQSVKPKPVD